MCTAVTCDDSVVFQVQDRVLLILKIPHRHTLYDMQNLKHGTERGANSAAGWKALAELQYQNRQFQEAYDTAVNGLEWSVKRRRAGHEQLTSFALALRLVVAQCLRRLQRLDEAEYNFQVLAGTAPP